MASLKIMQLSESSFSEGRTQLSIEQKNQAITAFINDDFKNQLLAEQTTAATYENMAMPADLHGDHILNLATIFGNGSRFAFAVPKCVLVDQAEPTLGYFTFAADCHMIGGKTIASLINIPLDAGAKIAFAIDIEGQGHDAQQANQLPMLALAWWQNYLSMIRPVCDWQAMRQRLFPATAIFCFRVLWLLKKPTQRGITRHFLKIAARSPMGSI